ncbi:MAG: protein kinase [Candidatus Eremiobacterota bacterium]
MQIDKDWIFEEALSIITDNYPPIGPIRGPQRNRQIESWGQIVGRTRAIAEFESAIEQYGSLTAFGRKYHMAPRTLRDLKEFFKSLPDDRIRGSIYPGLKLGGWRLLRQLGKGGNSKVWHAKDINSQHAAIKILKRARGISLKRFISEITILQQLKDVPGILPIIASVSLEQIEQEEYAWLVTPIALPIKDAIFKDTTPQDILHGITHIAATITELHSLEITHRDIKPDNIYILNDEWVIGDFGIASFPDKESLTLPNQKLGPLHYIAPEMLMNADMADARKADVYSLAKTLWVLLTGQIYPPPGEQRCDVPSMRISTWVIINKSNIIDELIERATRHEPEERPTMREFRDILINVISQKGYFDTSP